MPHVAKVVAEELRPDRVERALAVQELPHEINPVRAAVSRPLRLLRPLRPDPVQTRLGWKPDA